jgi:hypothetical protein
LRFIHLTSLTGHIDGPKGHFSPPMRQLSALPQKPAESAGFMVIEQSLNHL